MLTCSPPIFINVAQQGDARALMQSLPVCLCAALTIFDAQYRAVLDLLQFGNEASRQRGRATLSPMSEAYIDDIRRECARVSKPSGYFAQWVDAFSLLRGHHLRVK